MIYIVTLIKHDVSVKVFYATTYPQAVMCKQLLDDIHTGKNVDRNISVYKTTIESKETFDDNDYYMRHHVYGYHITIHFNPDNMEDMGFEICEVFGWNDPAECRINSSYFGKSGYWFVDLFITAESANEAITNAKEYINRPSVLKELENKNNY
jgi:hypothetical protein